MTTNNSIENVLGEQAADAAAKAAHPIVATASDPVTRSIAFVTAAARLCGFAAANIHLTHPDLTREDCFKIVRTMMFGGLSPETPVAAMGWVARSDSDGIPRDADLILVMEEAAEVIQAAAKIHRFGPNDFHPTYHNGVPNTEALAIEIGQLLCCIGRLGLPADVIEAARIEKAKKLLIYGPEGTYLAEKKRETNDGPRIASGGDGEAD